MFWVLEQEGRPRQQLPLSIYIISVIPQSDLDLCFTASHLSSTLSSLAVCPPFSLVPLATFRFRVHRAGGRIECDCIMEIEL